MAASRHHGQKRPKNAFDRDRSDRACIELDQTKKPSGKPVPAPILECPDIIEEIIAEDSRFGRHDPWQDLEVSDPIYEGKENRIDDIASKSDDCVFDEPAGGRIAHTGMDADSQGAKDGW